MMNWEIILGRLNDAALLLAVAIGLYRYRSLDQFHRLMLLLAVIAIIIDWSANRVLAYQVSIGLPVDQMNNQWVYNIYIAIEPVLLLWAARMHFDKPIQQTRLSIGILVFLVIYLSEIIIGRYDQLANISYLVGAVIVVPVYQVILFIKMRQSAMPLWELPEFWLCSGISIYFACNSPYIGLMHHLSADLSNQLFYITAILAIVRYLFLCISMLLATRRQTITTG
jgi:hypothetical protein